MVADHCADAQITVTMPKGAKAGDMVATGAADSFKVAVPEDIEPGATFVASVPAGVPSPPPSPASGGGEKGCCCDCTIS
jgi:hypothetical protein